MIMNNKRGVAPLFIVGIILAILLVFYLLLFIPIPAFTKIRSMINFWLILGLWIIVQVGFIYIYVELGKFAYKGYKWFRRNFTNAGIKLERFVVTHS